MNIKEIKDLIKENEGKGFVITLSSDIEQTVVFHEGKGYGLVDDINYSVADEIVQDEYMDFERLIKELSSYNKFLKMIGDKIISIEFK